MHISKGITGFSRWTYWVVIGVYSMPGCILPYWVVVGKYYLTHISKLITGFSRWTLGVFGRPYWVVVGKYYLTHISKLITGFSRCTPGVYDLCIYTHINSDQRVYLMVSRAKPGKIASSPTIIGERYFVRHGQNRGRRPRFCFDNKIAKCEAFCNFASEANSACYPQDSWLPGAIFTFILDPPLMFTYRSVRSQFDVFWTIVELDCSMYIVHAFCSDGGFGRHNSLTKHRYMYCSHVFPVTNSFTQLIDCVIEASRNSN